MRYVKTVLEVFSSGGGTQSACIAALIVQGRLPKPDFSVIADTERERSAVWEYHDQVVAPALVKIGVTMHRVSCRDYGYARENLFNKKGSLLIPAYSSRDGAGKLSNFCSTYWKIDTVDNWLSREHSVKRVDYRKWIGFSMDEGRRYSRMALNKDGVRGLIRFPLIEDVPMTRKQAIKEVEKMGWPTPPRSACWMCPNQGDAEWRDLRDNKPEEFAKAIALENEVRERDPNAFLHKSLQPLSEVNFDTPKDDLFEYAAACSSGTCFV